MITKAKPNIENVKKLGRGPILEILLNYVRKFGSYLTETSFFSVKWPAVNTV